MALLTEFKFFDYTQSPIFFYLEQLAIIFCLSFLTYSIVFLVSKRRKVK